MSAHVALKFIDRLSEIGCDTWEQELNADRIHHWRQEQALSILRQVLRTGWKSVCVNWTVLSGR